MNRNAMGCSPFFNVFFVLRMIFTEAINKMLGKTWVKHIWQIYKKSSKSKQSQNSLIIKTLQGFAKYSKECKTLIFCLTSRGSLVRIQ